MKQFFIIFALCIPFLLFGQDEDPQDLLNRAKKAEKAGQFAQAGNLYSEASDVLLKEAEFGIENSMSHVYITARFVMAKTSYEKAAVNYGKGKMYALKKAAEEKATAVGERMAREGYQIGGSTQPIAKEPEEKGPDPIGEELDTAISLTTKFAQFRFNPPKAYKYVGKDGEVGPTNFTTITLRKTSQKVEIGLIESGFAANGFALNDDFGKNVCDNIGDPDKKNQQKFDDQTKEQIAKLQQQGILAPDIGKQLGVNDAIYKEVRDIGAGVNACFMVEDKSNHPDGSQFVITILFAYKGNQYLFGVVAPMHWKDALVASAKTFQISGVAPPPAEKCSGNEVYVLEGYSFYDTYRIPNPEEGVSFGYSPTIQRGKVQDGWHAIADGLKRGLFIFNGIRVVLKKREAYYEQTESGNYILVQMLPKLLQLDELAKPNSAGLYIEAFDRIVTGVQGLESQISHMTADFDYAIPYIDIKVKCTPQMKCVNGAWKPDYQNMVYQVVKRDTGVEKNHLTFLTMREILKRQEKIGEEYDNMVMNYKRFLESENCRLHQYKLIHVPFPAEPDECDKLEAQIKSNEMYREQSIQQIAAKERELAVFKSTKLMKATDIDTEMDTYNAELKTEKDKKKRAEDQLRNWKSNSTNSDIKEGNIDRLNTEIAQHSENINRIETILIILKKEYKKYIDGQLDDTWQREIDEQKQAVKKLEADIKTQKQKLRTCREEERKRN